MYTIIVLSILIALAVFLYMNRDKYKGFRNTIMSVAGGSFSFATTFITQLEMFPWKEYLTPQHALISTMGVLALVTLFASLKRTDR